MRLTPEREPQEEGGQAQKSSSSERSCLLIDADGQGPNLPSRPPSPVDELLSCRLLPRVTDLEQCAIRIPRRP